MGNCGCKSFLVGNLRLILLTLDYLVDRTDLNDDALWLFKLDSLNFQFDNLIWTQTFIGTLFFFYDLKIQQTILGMTQKNDFFERKQTFFCKAIQVWINLILKFCIFKMPWCLFKFAFFMFTKFVALKLLFVKICFIFKLRNDILIELWVISKKEGRHTFVHKKNVNEIVIL